MRVLDAVDSSPLGTDGEEERRWCKIGGLDAVRDGVGRGCEGTGLGCTYLGFEVVGLASGLIATFPTDNSSLGAVMLFRVGCTS